MPFGILFWINGGQVKVKIRINSAKRIFTSY